MQHVTDTEGGAASLVRRGTRTTILLHKQAGRRRSVLVVLILVVFDGYKYVRGRIRTSHYISCHVW